MYIVPRYDIKSLSYAWHLLVTIVKKDTNNAYSVFDIKYQNLKTVGTQVFMFVLRVLHHIWGAYIWGNWPKWKDQPM